MKKVRDTEIQYSKSEYLRGKCARGIELLADQITGGDVRNTEKIGKTGSIGAFTYTRTAKKHPLDISVLRFLTERGGNARKKRRCFEVSFGIQRS